MKTNLASAALFAESLQLTLQQKNGSSTATALRNAPVIRARDIAWQGQSASPFKLRDPIAQRRLLVAS
jgi:hypothetical protein